jgi:endo-1,4-beta-xylanase
MRARVNLQLASIRGLRLLPFLLLLLPASVSGAANYVVTLPPEYDSQPERRFPVVYWLHGLNGAPRPEQAFAVLAAEAMRDGRAPQMIIVQIDGLRNSMYCDSKDGAKPVERVFIEEVIPKIDSTYRTIRHRRGRAIEGYSMGGFGAARLGIKYSHLFSAISIMAGALHTGDSLAERRKSIFDEIFGADKEYYRHCSPWVIAETMGPKVERPLRARIGVGDQDPLKHWNRQFHELLAKTGIANEFFLVEGIGHNGAAFYRKMGDPLWRFYREAFPSTHGIQ